MMMVSSLVILSEHLVVPFTGSLKNPATFPVLKQHSLVKLTRFFNWKEKQRCSLTLCSSTKMPCVQNFQPLQIQDFGISRKTSNA